MSVEQTSQLLQLILNSVLMVAVCGLVLLGLLAHQGTLYQRLQWLHRECREQLVGTVLLERDRFRALKRQQHTLRLRYRQAQTSIALGYIALLALLCSTLLLACRTFLQVNSLIPSSLVFFVLGNLALLLSAGLTLLEIQRGRNAVLAELRDWVRGVDPQREAPRLLLPPATERRREGRSRRRARVG